MSERGSVPIELAMGAGLLVLPMAILVLSFGPMAEGRTMARAAAAEAARLVALGGPTNNLEPEAVEMVRLMATNAGLDADVVTVEFCEGTCQPVARGGVVVVSVSVAVPAVVTPFGTLTGTAVGEHVEAVDLYRSFP
ncbi:MAG TPA: hypothetical protein VJ398_02435 [Acidimicrobiia bacterium]|nr:hypothetical protein [Acidimicrobiia bacterium]